MTAVSLLAPRGVTGKAVCHLPLSTPGLAQFVATALSGPIINACVLWADTLRSTGTTNESDASEKQSKARLPKGDVVMAPKLDRLFRSALDAVKAVEDLTTRGVALHLLESRRRYLVRVSDAQMARGRLRSYSIAAGGLTLKELLRTQA